MNLSQLQRPRVPKPRKRVGRGAGSGKGTTAARGTKGQRARTGGRGGLKLMGLKVTVMKLPKLGGFKSRHPKMQPVNVGLVNNAFNENDEVTARALHKRGMIADAGAKVKLLGEGKLTKKLRFTVHAASASAQKAVAAAGGTISLIPRRKTGNPTEDRAPKEK
ncbi:MAG: 50S ribosomal protein L15 [Patescibacteria group bacterium]